VHRWLVDSRLVEGRSVRNDGFVGVLGFDIGFDIEERELFVISAHRVSAKIRMRTG